MVHRLGLKFAQVFCTALMFVPAAGVLQAQNAADDTATITGSEPPVRTPQAAPAPARATPPPPPPAPAIPAPTSKAVLPPAATKPPATARKAKPAVNTAVELSAKVRDLTNKMNDLQKKSGVGGAVIKKWADTVEIFKKFEIAAKEEALNCQVQRERLDREEERHATEFVIKALKEQLAFCEKETTRNAEVETVLAGKFNDAKVEIERIEADLVSIGQITDETAKAIKKAEAEKAIVQSLDVLGGEVATYQAQ